MWMTRNGHSKALAGVATAGVVALTVSGVTAGPAAALPDIHPTATVFTPVELTGQFGDSTLMDIVGALTGLSFIIPILDDPENPLFPFVLSLEALGELFVVIPLTLLFGTPALLITEGLQGIQDMVSLLGTAFDGVVTLVEGLVEWYETHNWFTGALLDAGSSEAGDISGWADLLGGHDVFTPGGLEDVITVDGLDTVFAADGFDAVLTDFGLGDLIA